MKSESIKQLTTALSVVQSELKGAKMDSENPFFKSKYADLTAIWSSCRSVLTKNGFAVIQTMDFDPSTGKTFVVTTLSHKSGEWMEGKLAVNPEKNTPQGMGSAITYARRYSLAAIVGVAPEGDDDGEGATDRTKQRKNSNNQDGSKSQNGSNARPPASKATPTVGDPQKKTISPISIKAFVSKKNGKHYWEVTDIDESTYLLHDKEKAKIIKQSVELKAKIPIKFIVDQHGATITALVPVN